jgi:hypothetical protein
VYVDAGAGQGAEGDCPRTLLRAQGSFMMDFSLWSAILLRTNIRENSKEDKKKERGAKTRNDFNDLPLILFSYIIVSGPRAKG